MSAMRGVATHGAVALLAIGATWLVRGEVDARTRAAKHLELGQAAEKRRAADRECELQLPNGHPEVPIFDGLSEAREIVAAAKRGESDATLQVILKSSDGFIVPRGTRCSLIETRRSEGVSEVRILEGDHATKTGWVPIIWRTRNAP